jgi:hypothetical protein
MNIKMLVDSTNLVDAESCVEEESWCFYWQRDGLGVVFEYTGVRLSRMLSDSMMQEQRTVVPCGC